MCKKKRSTDDHDSVVKRFMYILKALKEAAMHFTLSEIAW
jgi:hypothetical protein